MPRLNDIPLGEANSYLIYGGAKTGKTIIAGSAGSRNLFINIGDGITTLQSKWFRDKYKANPIIETLWEKAAPKEPKAFDDVCRIIDKYLKEMPDEFDTVTIDDITTLRDMAMAKAIKINADLQMSKTYDYSQKYGVINPAIQDYKGEMNLIGDKFISEYKNILREAGKNLVMVAHQRIIFKKGDKIGDIPTIYKIFPWFTGEKSPDAEPGKFDFVWYTEAVGDGVNTVYRARTRGNDVIYAGDRFPDLFPTLLVNPNLSKVFEAVRTQTKYNGENK